MHEVDLLFECILIRDGHAALPCWFPKSDVQTTVNYICTALVFFAKFFVFRMICIMNDKLCDVLYDMTES